MQFDAEELLIANHQTALRAFQLTFGGEVKWHTSHVFPLPGL
uniref:Uncharacterized protein n=1 Tax=Anguilla anguilla TaxID=7936 RepID=A0A0E9VVG0_ANGAN